MTIDPTGRRPEDRLSDLGLELPTAFPPAANYVSVRIDGLTAWVSGHGPMRDGQAPFTGKLGRDCSAEDGYESAKLTCLNILASLKAALGELSRIAGFAKLLILVNAADDFTGHPAIANGASDLLFEVFGPGALHARSAIGVASLPWNIATEIEAVVLLHPEPTAGIGN